MTKRISVACLAVVFLLSLSNALTWQKDSAPFAFPGASGVKKNSRPKPHLALSYSQSARQGVFSVSNGRSAPMSGAAVSIFRADGALVQVLAIASGNATAVWDLAQGNVSTGIYLARIVHEGASREIRIAITK